MTPNDADPRTGRFAGALLGVHAGDSLGAALEFDTWESIRRAHPTGLRDIVGGGPFDWPPGHATDDTDLTRAVLLAYLDQDADPGRDVVRSAADHMLDWVKGHWPGRRPGDRPKDIGGATATGLSTYSRHRDPARSGAGVGQAGNGSLMRCIPTALARSRDTDKDRRLSEAMAISAITHDDPRCTIACAAYVEAVVALLDDPQPRQALAVALETAEHAAQRLGVGMDVAIAVQAAEELSLTDMADRGQVDVVGAGSGYVLNALTIAFTALLDHRPLEDALVDVVRIGSDTDTNAAIAGGLLGARDGVDGIPARWLDILQFRDEFLEAAYRLATR
jgi:ADP-ribosylglycohydrolase